MGTALAVAPFNRIIHTVEENCPKVLINLENTLLTGFDFDSEDRPERLFLQGKADEVVAKIASECGWSDELDKRTANCTKLGAEAIKEF